MSKQLDGSWVGRERAIEELLAGNSIQTRKLLLARIEEYARGAIAAAHGDPESVSHTPVGADAWLERPIFVCGAHRSGTTLMQSLLDGHPDLVVLPSEATYLTSFGYVACTRPVQSDVDRFIAEWVARMIDPNDVPHFKLGRSSEDRSPTLDFCHSILKWMSKLQAAISPRARFSALLALAAAYRDVAATEIVPRMWVEKTPLNENHASLLLRSFDHARCIQMIRDPRATYLSHHAAYLAGNLQGFDRFATARTIGRSLRLAARNMRQWEGRYLVIRYEDLTDNPAHEMGRVCEFLGIEPHPVLLTPTTRGIPVRSNSSFQKTSPGIVEVRHNAEISTLDARLISALAGSQARPWGYAVPRVRAWEACAFRLRGLLGDLSRLSRRVGGEDVDG